MTKRNNNKQAGTQQTQEDFKVRLDKWLWASRFFKTRTLASEAIKGGKVHVNQHRVKPSHLVQTGEQIRIRKGDVEFTLIVTRLSNQRGPASIAQTLYQETEQSLALRHQRAQERRELQSRLAAPQKRPDKKQRRQIVRFKQQYHHS